MAKNKSIATSCSKLLFNLSSNPQKSIEPKSLLSRLKLQNLRLAEACSPVFIAPAMNGQGKREREIQNCWPWPFYWVFYSPAPAETNYFTSAEPPRVQNVVTTKPNFPSRSLIGGRLGLLLSMCDRWYRDTGSNLNEIRIMFLLSHFCLWPLAKDQGITWVVVVVHVVLVLHHMVHFLIKRNFKRKKFSRAGIWAWDLQIPSLALYQLS